MFGANIQTLALVQERHDDKELDCPPILGECCAGGCGDCNYNACATDLCPDIKCCGGWCLFDGNSPF